MEYKWFCFLPIHACMAWLHLVFSAVLQEQFCFGEDINAEITSFEALPVNITRARPACGQASVSLTLNFEDNGTLSCEFMCSSWLRTEWLGKFIHLISGNTSWNAENNNIQTFWQPTCGCLQKWITYWMIDWWRQLLVAETSELLFSVFWLVFPLIEGNVFIVSHTGHVANAGNVCIYILSFIICI